LYTCVFQTASGNFIPMGFILQRGDVGGRFSVEYPLGLKPTCVFLSQHPKEPSVYDNKYDHVDWLLPYISCLRETGTGHSVVARRASVRVRAAAVLSSPSGSASASWLGSSTATAGSVHVSSTWEAIFRLQDTKLSSYSSSRPCFLRTVLQHPMECNAIITTSDSSECTQRYASTAHGPGGGHCRYCSTYGVWNSHRERMKAVYCFVALHVTTAAT
jgi:hypothetical protein